MGFMSIAMQVAGNDVSMLVIIFMLGIIIGLLLFF